MGDKASIFSLIVALLFLTQGNSLLANGMTWILRIRSIPRCTARLVRTVAISKVSRDREETMVIYTRKPGKPELDLDTR